MTYSPKNGLFVSKGGKNVAKPNTTEAHIPQPHPLMGVAEPICAEIFYEKRYTTLNDETLDGDHIHDFYEIYVNLSGDVSFLVENSLYAIRRGDVIITRPNEIHRCILHSDCDHEHFVIWLKGFPFASEKLKAEFEKRTLIAMPKEEKELLIQNCFAFHECQTGKDTLWLREAQYFFAIMDMICSGYKKDVPAEILPDALERIVEYISAHYDEPACTVARIGEEFYISKSTLCRYFRRYFQSTPSDYIESKRFSEARKLLTAGVSVQTACLNSGFSDCSHFIRRFRKKFGTTPYRYQKELLRPKE